MRSQLYAAGVLVGVCLLASPVSTTAAPLAGAASKGLLTQTDGNSLVIQVQRRIRGGGGGGGGGGGNAAGAVAAGVAAGLLLGVIANEAVRQNEQRQDSVDYCARRYRSYDPESGTYMGKDGVRRPCG
jgi:hypothetical protein